MNSEETDIQMQTPLLLQWVMSVFSLTTISLCIWESDKSSSERRNLMAFTASTRFCRWLRSRARRKNRRLAEAVCPSRDLLSYLKWDGRESGRGVSREREREKKLFLDLCCWSTFILAVQTPLEWESWLQLLLKFHTFSLKHTSSRL